MLKNIETSTGKTVNGTGSEGNNCAEAVPTTAREFERWLAGQDRSGWTLGLKLGSERALLTLRSMDQPAFAQSDALQRLAKADLQAFAAAYAEWRG